MRPADPAARRAPSGRPNPPLDRLREQARAASDAERLAESDALWREVLTKRPRDIEAIGNLALNAAARGQLEEAEKRWREAIGIAPRNAGIWGNLAEVYRQMFLPRKAEEAVREALRLAPGKLDVRMALANILWDQRRIEEALTESRRIPDEGMLGSTAANLRGNLFSHLGYGEKARKEFERALELRPGFPNYASNHLLALLYDETLTPAEVHAAHRGFGAFVDRPRTVETRDPDPSRPLRVGFLSADFRIHSVGYFIEPLLGAMDRKQFEITLYSAVAQPDDLTRVIAGHAARLVTVLGLSDEELAERCAADGIDMLIDLSGHTRGNRMPALGHRLAPIQLSWLGYPHTTGLSCIDVRLSDAVIEPLPESQALSTEKIWHIPEGCHLYRMPGEEEPLTELPLLRSGRPTFICCNNSAKISPSTLALWARVLREFPESRLLLKNSGFVYPARGDEVKAFFAAAGVEPARVEIRPLVDSVRAHVATYGEADIALDTHPYNGTTTTCEALWMGIPVMTLRGESARARHSASLLRQVGLEDWVGADEDAYLARLREALARPQELSALRASLRDRLRHSPLGHPVHFAGRFQATLRRIWVAHCAALGASPEALEAGEERARRDLLRGQAALDVARAQWLERRGERVAALDAWWAVARSGFLPDAWPEVARRVEASGDAAAVHAVWREASAKHPERAAFHAARAEAARSAGDLADAADAYAAALDRAPDHPGVWMNFAAVLRALNRPVAAEEAARRALALKPDFPEAWNNLGGALRDQARFDEAVDAFCHGLEHAPDNALLHSNLVYLLNFIPGLSAEDLAAQHAVFAERHFPEITGEREPPVRARPRSGGLRVAFLSADLRQHSVGQFMRAALPALREAGAEVHLFADVSQPDALTSELRAGAHRWVWTAGMEDEALATEISASAPDVLLELHGHTAGNRLLLFRRRLAPWQGSWLGYPHPLQLPVLDGFLSDTTIHPAEASGLLRLRQCVLPYALPDNLPEASPAEPDAALTFGAFHNLPKLNEGVWTDWIQLLEAFPASRLLVKSRQLEEAEHRSRFVRRLEEMGAPLDRIELLPHAPSMRAHLEDYRRVDLALDPSPYNGVTTTMEALAMGVPVLTVPGVTPASRHAASLLQTYRGGKGVCSDLSAIIGTVQRWTAGLGPFRAERSRRQAEFSQAVETYRKQWAEAFLGVLDAAVVSALTEHKHLPHHD